MRLLLALAAQLAAPVAAPVAAQAPGDAVAGARNFRACAPCHQIGEGARHGVGPALTAIMGRPAARQAEFRYSAAMAQAGARGLVWTRETLGAFLENPRATLPGTSMAYAGLRDPERRSDLLAYLESFSPQGELKTGPESDPESLLPGHLRPGDPELPPGLRDLPGDVEYGEYLAQECVTCHQRSGADQGIPAITGWPEAELARALHAYRAGARENAAMRMVASRLDDEAIAALAAYFATLGE